MTRRYEFKEHTADIIARAYGETLEDAFASAAGAMFDLLTDGSVISGNEAVEFEVESIDLEGLLVGFLSELIVLHEADRLVLHDFKVEFVGETQLKATVIGERFDSNKHGGGTQVKGVSYHLLEIRRGETGEPVSLQVLFDI